VFFLICLSEYYVRFASHFREAVGVVVPLETLRKTLLINGIQYRK